jgi:hypothetical protein
MLADPEVFVLADPTETSTNRWIATIPAAFVCAINMTIVRVIVANRNPLRPRRRPAQISPNRNTPAVKTSTFDPK